MKVNSPSSINFKGAFNNKFLLKILEKISDHSATFTTAVAVGASMFLRPAVISVVPNVKKENKEHSISASVSSGIIKFLTASALSIPIETIVKNIENNPQKFISSDSVEFLKDKKAFNFASQILKLSTNVVTAIPKSILTVALIPVIVDKIYKNSSQNQDKNKISFKGKLKDNASKIISKYYNNKVVQKFAMGNSSNSKNMARNLSAITDIILTSSFAINTKNSKKIKPERKNNLIYNNILSTAFSVAAGFGLDNLIQKQGEGFIGKFVNANKGNPKLTKYLQGINVIRPAIIFSFVYYGLLPFITNYFSQKISDSKETKTTT